MLLGRTARIVFIVGDFSASLAFYRDILGLELQGSVEKEWACFDSGNTLLCLCGFNPAMPYEPHSIGKSPDQHLFLVEDIDAAREELIRRGVDVKPVQQMSSSVRIAEFRDPDGRYLGLEERSD